MDHDATDRDEPNRLPPDNAGQPRFVGLDPDVFRFVEAVFAIHVSNILLKATEGYYAKRN